MKVLGTAGHVDHGKSALVLALTGMNPDRLQEEIDRQMTIDLGFAWMTLSNGEEVGIVDVPGHRDFIDNMLAGVTGFDAAMLVIASDEGVMPQTREHISILDLLEVNHGVVALTKVDLIEDPEWLELIAEDIRKLLENTSLDGVPIIPVSAKTHQGIEELNDELADVLSITSEREDTGRPRLPVDRAFTISGFGTVVTGTLQGGSLELGQEVEILPRSTRGRIRGLQTHKHAVQVAIPGSRTAANISGVEVSAISRGDVVAHPNTYQASTMIDVSYRHLSQVEVPLKHDQRVKVFLGAAQRVARVRVLGVEKVLPGQTGFLQLMIDDPLVAERGDHYILRRPSPGLTLGGGRVIDPNPKGRHRRFDISLIGGLEKLVQGDLQDLIMHTLTQGGISSVKVVIEKVGRPVEETMQEIKMLISRGDVIVLSQSKKELAVRDLFVDKDSWEELVSKIKMVLNDFHAQFPLRFGMSREELKSRLKLNGQEYSQILMHLTESGILDVSEVSVSRKDYTPELSEEQRELVNELITKFKEKPFATPSVKESSSLIGEDLYAYLIQSGELIQLSSDVVFTAADYMNMVERVKGALLDQGTVTVAEVRDLFGTTRKYALALMEYLDDVGITFREGDVRKLSSEVTSP